MPYVTGDTVKQILRDLYGYEVSDADANAISHAAGAMLTLAGEMTKLGLAEIEPPFGYTVLTGESSRLLKKK